MWCSTTLWNMLLPLDMLSQYRFHFKDLTVIWDKSVPGWKDLEIWPDLPLNLPPTPPINTLHLHAGKQVRTEGNWKFLPPEKKGKIVVGRKVESQVLVNCLVSRCSLFIFTFLVSVYGNQIFSRSSLALLPSWREHIWLARPLVWDRSTGADT